MSLGPLIMLFLFYTVARELHKQPHWKDSLYADAGSRHRQTRVEIICNVWIDVCKLDSRNN